MTSEIKIDFRSEIILGAGLYFDITRQYTFKSIFI